MKGVEANGYFPQDALEFDLDVRVEAKVNLAGPDSVFALQRTNLSALARVINTPVRLPIPVNCTHEERLG